MFDMAQRSERFLGGRPPFGYQLADVGPHPNPGKAAVGQRMHKLVPDPATAPVVAGIFDMFVREGTSLRLIAQRLMAAGVPSPSAYDPARNRHRDPVGWAFSAVRAILSNPTYTGYRVWGKQQKVEVLIDPEDVAAGNRTFMRWRDKGAWVRSDEPTHAPLITEELFDAAQLKFAAKGQPRARRGRDSFASDRFSLRGLICCGICGSRSRERSANPSARMARTDLLSVRHSAFTGAPRGVRSPSVGLCPPGADHHHLNEWIDALADPAILAAGQDDDGAVAAAATELQRRVRQVESKLANLVASIEAGIDPTVIAPQIAARTAERNELQSRLRQMLTAKRASAKQIEEEINFFGGVAPMLAKATLASCSTSTARCGSG